jgi:uncharacterized protein (DUF433 family)
MGSIIFPPPKLLWQPLRNDGNGILFVGETGVRFETVWHAHRRGSSAEEIVGQFEKLNLPDVYAVLAWAYRHPEDVKAYLQDRDRDHDRDHDPSPSLKECPGCRTKVPSAALCCSCIWNFYPFPLMYLSSSDSSNLLLEDPLRSIRSFLRILLRIGLWLQVPYVVIMFVILVILDSDFFIPILVVAILSALAYWFTFVLWAGFMPSRVTNALYLRSFRKDPDTVQIRIAIQEALGPSFRLSGIRDPRRRRVRLHEMLNPALLAMRYCTPKFLDLEAGDDWKARLWNSAQRADLVFIDISDLTSSVVEEIQLTSQCIELERLVFVGRPSTDEEHIKDLVTSCLPVGVSAQGINVLIWNNTTLGRRAFSQRVRELEIGSTKSKHTGFLPPPVWCDPPPKKVPLIRRKAFQYGLGMLLANLAFGVGGALATKARVGVAVGVYALLLVNMIVYIRDVGVTYLRRKAMWRLLVAGIFLCISLLVLVYL